MLIARQFAAAVSGAVVALAVAGPAVGVAVAKPYPPAVRTMFVHLCQEHGESQSGCACAIDYIQAHQSLRRFEVTALRYDAGGPIPAEMVQAAKACGISVS